MRTQLILTILFLPVICHAQTTDPKGPQDPQYQGIAEKQPIDHAARGNEAGPIPGNFIAARPKVLVPELTEIPLVLRDDLKSGFTRPGSEVLFMVAEDVYAPGPVLVLTKGTPAIGHVVKSNGHYSFGRSGQLFLTCDYILAQDKTRIPLRAVEEQARGKSNMREAWAASILGGIAGGTLASAADHATRSWWPIAFVGPFVSLLIEGKNVNLHAGQHFVVHTERDVATSSPQSIFVASDEGPVDYSTKYQDLKRYPTVRMKSGDKLFGVVRNDEDGKWATVYGPLRNVSRVLVADIAAVE